MLAITIPLIVAAKVRMREAVRQSLFDEMFDEVFDMKRSVGHQFNK